MVTINELVSIVEGIGNITLERRYNLSAPKGVRGRNSENTLIKRVLGWEPDTSLQDGLTHTFRWIGKAMDEGKSDAGKSNGAKSKTAAAKSDGKKGAKDSGKTGRRSLVGKA
jgi:hypothetical protein